MLAAAAAPVECMGSDWAGGPYEPSMMVTSQQGTAACETHSKE